MNEHNRLAIINAINKITYELEEMVPNLRMDAHDSFAGTIEQTIELLSDLQYAFQTKLMRQMHEELETDREPGKYGNIDDPK